MFGDTKYYHIKQIIENHKCIGNLIMVGRAYGYIVQLHYYTEAGYRINQIFQTEREAERFYNSTAKTLGV